MEKQQIIKEIWKKTGRTDCFCKKAQRHRKFDQMLI